jgi:ribosome-binding protein aMBF1 (putative translation factor)
MGDGEPLSSYLFTFEPKISGQDIVHWDNSAPCVQSRNVRAINNLEVAAMTVGDRVRTHRKALGMSAIALAKRCSMSGARIARIELSGIQPRADIIRRLAKALNVSADYLLELDDKPRRLRAVKQKNDDVVFPEGGRRITARAPTPP